MVEVTVNVGTRNRFSFDIDKFIEENGFDRAKIITKGISFGRSEPNRYTISKTIYGDLNGEIFEIDILAETAVLQYFDCDREYDVSGKFRDEAHFDSGLELWKQFYRISWCYESDFIAESLEQIDYGFINKNGRFYAVSL